MVKKRLATSGSFKKGHTINNGRVSKLKGRKRPKEIVEKIRTSLKGRKVWNKGKRGIYSDEYRQKISLSLLGKKGELSRNWQGGKTSIAERLRKTFEYEDWRKKVFERDLYTCQKCWKIGGRLEADHIKPFSIFPELRLKVSNGQTLCIKCHRIKTNEDMKIIKSFLNSLMPKL